MISSHTQTRWRGVSLSRVARGAEYEHIKLAHGGAGSHAGHPAFHWQGGEHAACRATVAASTNRWSGFVVPTSRDGSVCNVGFIAAAALTHEALPEDPKTIQPFKGQSAVMMLQVWEHLSAAGIYQGACGCGNSRPSRRIMLKREHRAV
jgi:hypothetical protein